MKEGREMKLLLEELTLAIVLSEIEADLFAEEQTEEAGPEIQDLPFC